MSKEKAEIVMYENTIGSDHWEEKIITHANSDNIKIVSKWWSSDEPNDPECEETNVIELHKTKLSAYIKALQAMQVLLGE